MNIIEQTAVWLMGEAEWFYVQMLSARRCIASHEVPTAATDGSRIWYNEKFFAGLRDKEQVAVIVHELEHIVRLHAFRRQDRDATVWNMATDYVINSVLATCGFSLPKGALIDGRFNGMAEEQVYSLLAQERAKQPQQKPQSGQGQGQGNGQQGEPQPSGQSGQNQPGQKQQSSKGVKGNEQAPDKATGAGEGEGAGEDAAPNAPVFSGDIGSVVDSPLYGADANEAQDNMREEVLRAALVAKSMGKVPGHIAGLVNEMTTAKVRWEDELRNFLTAIAADDWSFCRPNKRFADSGLGMPSLHSQRIGCIAIAIDTSGSIGQSEFNQFMGEVTAIFDGLRPENVLLIQCDASIQDVREVQDVDELKNIQLCGGGGTDFRPVFAEVENHETPAALVYLTDGYGTFPESEVSYPVLWACTTDVVAPWGITLPVSLNN